MWESCNASLNAILVESGVITLEQEIHPQNFGLSRTFKCYPDSVTWNIEVDKHALCIIDSIHVCHVE
jgi:hypothetical protein